MAVVMEPTIIAPIKLTDVSNTALRDSIAHALDGVDYGHGHILLDVTNKGGGVIVAHKFGDGKIDWELVAGARYSLTDGGEVQVRVVGGW